MLVHIQFFMFIMINGYCHHFYILSLLYFMPLLPLFSSISLVPYLQVKTRLLVQSLLDTASLLYQKDFFTVNINSFELITKHWTSLSCIYKRLGLPRKLGVLVSMLR